MAQRRAQGASQSPGEDSGDDLDAFMQSRKASASSSSDLKMPTLFAPSIPRTPPSSEAAAKLGQPMVQLAPPMADTTQIPRNVFTGGAQVPGMATEEEKARWRASLSDEERQQLEEFEQRQKAEGTPGYENVVAAQGVKRLGRGIRDVAGDISGYGPKADPSQSLLDVTGFVPPEKRREHPYQTGITQAVTGLGSPENVALMAGTAGLGELPALARAGISAYFAAQMVQGAYDQIPGIEDARKRGDWPEVKRLATLAGVNVLMGAAAGAHGIKEAGLGPEVAPSPFVKKGTINEPLARDAAAGGAERAAPEGTIGPKQEPLAPEAPKTIKIQVDGLEKGTNKVVYIPKGTENLPAPPENAKVTVVPGEQAGAGTWYHTADVKPILILKKVQDGTFGELLGNHQSKQEALGAQAPTAIVARDGDGTEIKASLVDSSKPEVVAAQVATLQRQFPDAKITIEKPEDVVHERLGTKPATAPAPTTATSTAPADLQPIIENDAMDLFVAARQVRRFDPDLADGLSDMADGRLHSPSDLQKFVDENIHDPEAKADLSKSVADYAAKSAGESTPEVGASSELRGAPRTAPGRTASRATASPARNELVAEAYRPGNVVKSYIGHDKVLEFMPGDPSKPYPANDWQVKVVASDEAGNPLPGARERIHATPPERVDLLAAQKRLAEKKAAPATPPQNARAKVENAAPSDYGRRQAQFFANLQRNPIEKEFAQSYLDARLKGKVEPTRSSSLDAQRATQLKSSIESRLSTEQPATLTERFSPNTISEAQEELRHGYELASSFEKPGRYHPDLGPEASPQEADRAWYGVSSSRKNVTEMFPWYGDIKQGADKLGELIAKGKGAEYDRLVGTIAEHIQSEKESAAPVIAEFAPKLKSLSEEIDGDDPELSEMLAQVANGDGRGFKNLRSYLQEKVANAEQARDFFKSVDTAAAEARQASAEESADQARELRAAESGRTAEGSEAATGEGTPAGSEFLTPQTVRQKAPAEKQNALPGFESAIDEQRASAEGVRGERLTSEANRPLGDVTSAAGEMERNSPLFRGTAASPQSDLFKSKPSESTAPEVGDHVQVTAGKLKGKTVEVTSATDEGGVYVRTDENSRIQYVKEGDFESQAKPPIKTRALDELVDPNDERFTGTRYSGLSPAALKKLLPESVREKLDTEVEANQRARGLQGQLYDLESKNAADLLRARNVLREAPGTPADMEAIYHHLEDPAVKLTSGQQKILDDYLRPILDESERINEKLDGGQVENYVHRIPVGKGSLLDRILGGESELSAGRGLSKSSASLKSRTMMAIEDAQGNRKVVSIKGGEVTAWERGKPSEMGEIRRPVNPGVNEYFDKNVMSKLEKLADDLGISHERFAKRVPGLGGRRMGVSLTGQNAIKTLAGTPEQVILHEIGHQLDERYNLQKDFVNNAQTKVELRKLSDLRYEGMDTSQNFKKYVRKGEEKMAVMFEAFLRAPERFRQVAPNTYGKFVNFLKSHEETRPILDIKPSLTIEKRNIGAEKNIPGTFLDKDGKRWNVAQATTKEIEANTGVRYYKNALASTVLNFLSLRKAERAYDFLESYKRSPEFQEVATKINGSRVPAGWRPSELPQFHGYAFEPHTAEVLDWYAKRMHAEGPNLYRQIGNFLRTAIFFNPLIHTPNIGVHWIVEKGLTGFGPQNWGRILRTGSRAIDAVIHQNNDFLSALDAGAPLQSARLDNGATTKLLLERMGRELEANPTAAQRVARALGYVNPAKLVRAIYNFSGKVTWVSNDIAMLQATYEHMEKTGSPFKEAVTDVSKHIPDYRLPTRIFNSTALAKLMSNPDLTMFGAYHYGALRSYGEMAKSLLSEDMPQAERMKSLDRMAMLGLFTFVAYPALDQLAKYLTGDKTAQFRRAGASTFIYNLAQLAHGEKSPTQVLEAVATPAVHTKALLQLAANRDFFTGRHIVDWNADAKTIGEQLARYGGQNLAPVNQGMQVTEGRRTFGQQVAGLAGIKTNVPTPAEALARKFAAESAGTAAPDQDTLERSYLRKQYESDLREKKITLQDLRRALTGGNITGQDAKTIVERAALTPLQNEFKGLPIEKALRVWQKADDQERETLRALLAAKAERINPAGYNPTQLKNLSSRIRSALIGGAPTAPPGHSWFTIPLTPPNGTGTAGRIRTGAPMTAPLSSMPASAN